MATIPTRLSDETDAAYQAACVYFTLGAKRSFAKVSAERGTHISNIAKWSTRYQWVARARDYDAAMAQEAADKQSAEYCESLARHRKRSEEASSGIYEMSKLVFDNLKTLMDNTVVMTDDGRLMPSAIKAAMVLPGVVKAIQAALDIEAHILGIDKILSSTTISADEKAPTE